jgi:hypothetical protein
MKLYIGLENRKPQFSESVETTAYEWLMEDPINRTLFIVDGIEIFAYADGSGTFRGDE